MTAKDADSQLEVAAQVAGRKSPHGKGSGSAGSRRPRATKSPHPGVVLLKPREGHPAWRARCEDPDTGKRVFIRLDPLGAGRNAQTRRRWAIEKAGAIGKRKDEIQSGAPRATGTKLGEAIARYYADHPRLRPRTRSTYQKGTDKLLEWCTAQGIKSADTLTLAKLVGFRSWLSGAKRQRSAPGAPRGARETTETPRAPAAVNVQIRSVKAVLRYLRSVGLLPRLSRDDLADGLKLLATPREAPEFLRGPEIKALIEAAEKHDGETFKATRAEHAGEILPGSTPRYAPIKPLILVTLLSGMRFGEVAGLDWVEVDLIEGEIRLGTRTKTKHARAITFEHSPMLGELLTSLHRPGATGRVWSMTIEQIRAAAKRLFRYGAPLGWSFQALRRTCGTFLTNAPGIFGASSAYRSARMLGHSVAVAERHYLGVVKVPKDAQTLEAAMGFEETTRF